MAKKIKKGKWAQKSAAKTVEELVDSFAFSLQEGDLLIARTPKAIPIEQMNVLETYLRSLVPVGVEVAVVSDNIDIQAIRPPEGESFVGAISKKVKEADGPKKEKPQYSPNLIYTNDEHHIKNNIWNNLPYELQKLIEVNGHNFGEELIKSISRELANQLDQFADNLLTEHTQMAKYINDSDTESEE